MMKQPNGVEEGTFEPKDRGKQEGVIIAPEDEGEVLLRKIARLKQELNGYNHIKQELRGCEAQLKASSWSSSSSKARSVSSSENSTVGQQQPTTYNHIDQNKSIASNDSEVYELLEEKQRLSYGTSPPTATSSRDRGNITKLNPAQSGKTDETSLISDMSRASSPTSSASFEKKESGLLHIYNTAPFSASKTEQASTDKQSDNASTTNTDRLMGQFTPSGAQQSRNNSFPGAVSVTGIASSTVSHQRLFLQSEVGGIDEESAFNEQPRAPDEASENGMLIEADLVDDELYRRTSSGPLVSAKRDPWYRRNQWWLAGALVLVVASIILVSVLTSVDLNPVPGAPTLSPTTELNGVEAEIKALILSSFPSAATFLMDETSSQTKALRWLTDQTFNDPSLFNPTHILQQYALASLYFSTLGESTWLQNNGWLNAPNECEWYGVECEARGEDKTGDQVVVRLSLPSNNVSGSIPADLSILSTGLVALDLSMNQLASTIPSELTFLSLLTTLDVGSNRLVGSIPQSIDALIMLENLDMSSNVLASSIPTEIERLVMLRSLNVQKNDLVGAIPSEIGLLTSLVYFNCESNRLAFAIPTEIGRLSRLESFHAGSNAFISLLPSELGSLESIRTLDLSNNLVTGTIPYHMTLLSTAKLLDLSGNLLTGAVPNNIGTLRGLTWLSLSDNGLTHLIPDSIGRIRGLAHLDVSGNDSQQSMIFESSAADSKRPEDIPWPELAQLTDMVYLDISGMAFYLYTDAFLQMTNLEVLRMSGSALSISTFYGNLIVSLTALSTTLREIDFSNNFVVEEVLPTELGLLTNLEILDLHGNSLPGTLPTEIGLLLQLSVLNLGNSNFSGTVPSEIFKITNLIDLNIAGRYADFKSPLTGSISSNIGQLTKLRRLNLGFSEIAGTIPSEIGLTQLEELHLHHTTIGGSIPTVIQSLTSLKTFTLHAAAVTGSIPVFDGTKFDKLERLDLFSTLLSGLIPTGLWSLSMLTLLNLGGTTRLVGSIPTAITQISSLAELNLAGVNMTESVLPSEIGLMSQLQVLDVTGASLSGTIPSELFLCTQLSSLHIGGNSFTGSLPIELGLTTNMLDLQISNSAITGGIPTEIGSLLLLERLDFSNTEIDGLIPSELTGRLFLLEDLNLGSTHISGSIPSDISNLVSLETLSLSDTDITGEIPSEIGMLANLVLFDIAQSSIVGTLPTEMTNMDFLAMMDLRGSNLTGSIPDILCDWVESTASGAIEYWKRTVVIDCEAMLCNCCQCDGIILESFSPTVTASMAIPSMSISPTASPSASVSPSETTSPTTTKACTAFTSIADVGMKIFGSEFADEGFANVALPFPFYWRGQSAYAAVSVSPNGVIILGDATNCETCGCYQDCCEAFPVGEFDGFGLPRIVLGQTDLQFDMQNPSVSANAYYATVDDTFIISYEGVTFFPAMENELNLYFQVVLYPTTGDIEMRWGQGFPREGINVAAGLEDIGIAVPVTGEPFDELGVSALGTWPSPQCRTFVATSNGNYTQMTL